MEVLKGAAEVLPGYGGATIAYGQTMAGRYLRVVFAVKPDCVLVITAMPLRGRQLRAHRRRCRRG
jgi:hypothetical protein